ncbi:unnamed protein product, partial [Amoebophrya sp. A120]|eukprot:GSA120T00018531001.1
MLCQRENVWHSFCAPTRPQIFSRVGVKMGGHCVIRAPAGLTALLLHAAALFLLCSLCIRVSVAITLDQWQIREPNGAQRLDVPGYGNRILFSFRIDNPTTPTTPAIPSPQTVPSLTLLSPPGYTFDVGCTRDVQYQHHLIFDATAPPAPVTDYASLSVNASDASGCVGSVEAGTGRGKMELQLLDTQLAINKIYPFAVRVTNPLQDYTPTDSTTASYNEWSLFLGGTSNFNASITAFPLRRFTNPKVRLSQRNRSPTCLNPTVTCPVLNIDNYDTGVSCLRSGCVEAAQVALEFGAFAAIPVGGRLEVQLPLYHSVSPYTTCEAWKLPKNADTWIPWLPKDLLCTVLPDLKSITMDFTDKTQMYLEPESFTYRFEFTILLPDGNTHKVSNPAQYYFWIFGYNPSAGFAPYADSIAYGVQVLRTGPGESSSREAVLASTVPPETNDPLFAFSGGTGIRTLSNSLFSLTPLPQNPYPTQGVRVGSLSLHDASDFFEVAAQSTAGPGRFTLGGEPLVIYFLIRFRLEIFPGTRVHLSGPLGYDFSAFCTSLVTVMMVDNLWTDQGAPDGWDCAASRTEMVLTRTGYVEFLGQTPLNLKVVAANPMVVEAWNKLDNFWELRVLGSSTTTTTTTTPQDCRGSWSGYGAPFEGTWSEGNCTDQLQTREFTVTTPATAGGKDCAHSNGAVDSLPCAERNDANCTGKFGPFDICANG